MLHCGQENDRSLLHEYFMWVRKELLSLYCFPHLPQEYPGSSGVGSQPKSITSINTAFAH